MQNNPGKNRAVVRINHSDYIVPTIPDLSQSPSHQNGQSQQNQPNQLDLLEPDAVIEQISPCPSCGVIQAVKTPGTGPHYAALRCANCSKFLRWLPKPKSGDAL